MKLPLIAAAVLLAAGTGVSAADKYTDWRKEGSQEQKLGKLVEIAPNTGQLMQQVGMRYRDLYWAAKQGAWDFAEYQAEELEELIDILQTASPKRAATAEEFLKRAYPQIQEAAASRDWERFQPAFETLRQACMECHKQNGHAFIRLPAAPRSAASVALEADD
jgi:hypothetical protein